MSEINRVPLKSIGSTKVDGKKIQEVGKTVRIALILPESNEDTCPEYHYKEQLAAAKVSYNRKWLRFMFKVQLYDTEKNIFLNFSLITKFR